MMSTYIRKYYLHRRVTAAGASLSLEKCQKTILIRPEQDDQIRANRYVRELQSRYQYGVQLLNPMVI